MIEKREVDVDVTAMGIAAPQIIKAETFIVVCDRCKEELMIYDDDDEGTRFQSEALARDWAGRIGWAVDAAGGVVCDVCLAAIALAEGGDA